MCLFFLSVRVILGIARLVCDGAWFVLQMVFVGEGVMLMSVYYGDGFTRFVKMSSDVGAPPPVGSSLAFENEPDPRLANSTNMHHYLLHKTKFLLEYPLTVHSLNIYFP